MPSAFQNLSEGVTLGPGALGTSHTLTVTVRHQAVGGKPQLEQHENPELHQRAMNAGPTKALMEIFIIFK